MLWLFEKMHPGKCDYICVYSIIVILRFVTSQTVCKILKLIKGYFILMQNAL